MEKNCLFDSVTNRNRKMNALNSETQNRESIKSQKSIKPESNP